MDYVRCFHAFSPACSPYIISIVWLLSLAYSLLSSYKLPSFRHLYLPLVNPPLLDSFPSTKCSAKHFFSKHAHVHLYFFNIPFILLLQCRSYFKLPLHTLPLSPSTLPSCPATLPPPGCISSFGRSLVVFLQTNMRVNTTCSCYIYYPAMALQ